MEARRTLRLILYVFFVTFAAARVAVFLIMDRWIPDLFLHVGGNHVHHLNSEDGAYINGEFFGVPDGQAVRDLFPMGRPKPFRIEGPA